VLNFETVRDLTDKIGMKVKEKLKRTAQKRRQHRVRAKIKGTKSRPRISVFRSNKHLYAQIINDEEGKTVVSVSDGELKKSAKGKKAEIATKIGELLAEKAKAKKITVVVFDKRHYKYHGRVKELAEGARKGGLRF